MKAFKHKRRVMLEYDQTAEIYDVQYSSEQKVKMQRALKHLNFNSAWLVLDLGCGTGLLFEYLKEKAQWIIGLDFSSEILRLAKRRVEGINQMSLIRADADHMPFRDELFHIIFVFTLLQNMPEPVQTLEEIKRVSKHGAKIVITGLKKSFSIKEFKALLQIAGLDVSELVSEGLKDYVAICLKNNKVC